MIVILLISFVFGQQIIPLIPNESDILKPWIGAFHPNGSIPVGKTSWRVRLQDDDLPAWVFNHDNDTGLNLRVLQTCDFNLTFQVARVKHHGETDWQGVFNSTNKGTITFCDVDNVEYQLIVVNKGSIPCNYVEMEVHIGAGQAICILEDLAKKRLRIILIIVGVVVAMCVCGCVLAVCGGVTACYCCCCKKKPVHYSQMQNQSNYVAPPTNNQAAYNQPVYNNAHVQNGPQYSQPQYAQPTYPPQQGYAPQPNQPYMQQPNQPNYQPNLYQQPQGTMPHNTNPHSEHV